MNMKLFAVAISMLVFTACAEKDPVPKVNDPNNIVVDGAPMTQAAFVKKYCKDKALHETCIMVKKAILANSSQGKVPRF